MREAWTFWVLVFDGCNNQLKRLVWIPTCCAQTKACWQIGAVCWAQAKACWQIWGVWWVQAKACWQCRVCWAQAMDTKACWLKVSVDIKLGNQNGIRQWEVVQTLLHFALDETFVLVSHWLEGTACPVWSETTCWVQVKSCWQVGGTCWAQASYVIDNQLAKPPAIQIRCSFLLIVVFGPPFWFLEALNVSCDEVTVLLP